MPISSQYQANEKHLELITLVSYGCISGVRDKLQEGWDPNVQNDDGITPILEAAERNDLETMKLLIDAGGKADVADIMGITPLKYAKKHRNEEMIRLIEETIKASHDQSKESLPPSAPLLLLHPLPLLRLQSYVQHKMNLVVFILF